MAQLDRFIELYEFNEDAMAAMADSQQQLKHACLATQRELEPADEYVALLRQRIMDLEIRSSRLQNALSDVTLPVLQQVAGSLSKGSNAAEGNSAGPQPSPLSTQLLEALLCTQQVLAAEAETGSSGCSSEAVSPAPKAARQDSAAAEVTQQGGPKSAPPTCGKATLAAGHSFRGQGAKSPNVAKVLSFGTSGRPTAVVHVLAHDV